ncbi:inositol monophosphatase family protein [Desulfovibrio sp. ZJ200]|uniref:inositol monophosphatase family protein n=1 Tax=Desulfovibrio sp. ZJ200 TaxID=2709792 RepID=UPI0013ED19A7|nr:inositol monophosphatase family protein [Desulfovibrio sp. ZJ200]
MSPASSLLQECVAIVRQSGEIIRSHWSQASQVRHKGSIDLVTETDLAVEVFLKENLARLLPGATFLAEESSRADQEPGELCWIIDPVDGTTNFVHRIPQVGTSVALWQGGRVMLGVVNVPMLDECFWAARGQGAFCNGKAAGVSRAAQLNDALVGTGFPYDVADHLPEIMARLAVVLPAAQGLRRIGAASIDLAYVACGRLDAFYEAGLKPWDLAAGWLLVEEAGGRVSNLRKDALRFGDALLASNGRLHDALADLFAGISPQ